MSDKTIDVRLKQRYDTEANWNSANPVLLEGEMAISSDKNSKYKVGNGTSTWKQLSYAKSNLEKSDVTSALGYTPPTTDECKTFIINVTKDTETDTYTADQTFDDAYAAYQAGRDVVMRRGATPYQLQTCAASMMTFAYHQYANIRSQIFSLMKNNTVNYHEYLKYASTLNPGGITAEAKQETDTVPVRIDSETGRAYVKNYDAELAEKADVDHTHNYAGSSSAGGSANSAVKLDTSAGSATQPVYFSGGKPVACTYTLAKSVPSNAVFTDTQYDVASGQTDGLMSASDKQKLDTIQQNANYYIHPSARSTSMGFWKIASNGNGHITNVSQVTKSDIADLGFKTYEEVSNTGPGLMSVLDKMKLDNIEDNANWYIHPNYLKLINDTPELVKIQYESNGHIKDVSSVTKSDLTSLGVADENHMHNYAGASNPGGAAYTAERLTIGSAGSSTTPVYFSNGSPIACNKSFDELKNEFILACYPVGSIYMSTSSTNPGSLFGGTWVAWGSGKVPVGINTSDGDFNTVEKTGGAKTVSLTTAQMPSHNHTVNSHTHSIPKLSGTANSAGAHSHTMTTRYQSDAVVNGSSARANSGGDKTTTTAVICGSAGAHTHSISTNAATSGSSAPSTNSQGSGSAHTNLQPYIVCYMWKRTE